MTETISYYIDKGKHYSVCLGKCTKLHINKHYFKFSTALKELHYYNEDDVEHTGINKLFGISNIFHGEKILGKIPLVNKLVNSCLLGWQPNFRIGNNMNIYLYGDEKGTEFKELLTSVTLPTEVVLEITRTKNSAIDIDIQLLSKKEIFTYNYEMDFGTGIKLGYILKPYFGGKSLAPKDFMFDVELTIE